MTTNPQFIPVIFPNYMIGLNDRSVLLPFLGHAGFILVDPNGRAGYYEYGLYPNGGIGVITNNQNGNVRFLELGALKYDTSGNISQDSLKGAFDKIVNGSNFYKEDPGMLFASPFKVNESQYSNIRLEIQNFIASNTLQSDGPAPAYGLWDNNCLSFVYKMAEAGHLNISVYQSSFSDIPSWINSRSPSWIPDLPSVSPFNILAQNGGGYEYFGPGSLNGNGLQSIASQAYINKLQSSDFEANLMRAAAKNALALRDKLQEFTKDPDSWAMTSWDRQDDGSTKYNYVSLAGDKMTKTLEEGHSEPAEVTLQPVEAPDITYKLDSNGSVESIVESRDGYSQMGLRVLQNGAAVQTIYRRDGGVVTSAFDALGRKTSESVVSSDGSLERNIYDPKTGEWMAKNSYDASGTITDQQFSASVDRQRFAYAVVDALAGQVIGQFLFKNNLPAALAAQALAHTVIDNTLNPFAGSVTAEAFSAQMATSLTGMVTGLLASGAGRDLFEGLGLPPELGGLAVGTVTQLGVQQLTNYIATDALGITQGFGTSMLNGSLSSTAFIGQLQDAFLTAGAGLAGGLLENALIDNRVGPGSSIGGAIGTTIAAAAASGPFAPLVVFLGSFFGSAIGGLFGAHPSAGPNAGAVVELDGASGRFTLTRSSADNGGDIDLARQLAWAASARINAVLDVIGGRVTGYDQNTVYSYGYYKGQYQTGRPGDAGSDRRFDDAEASVSDGVLRTLKALSITGGNVYMEYALAKSQATTLDGLLADLSAAHDYSLYAPNKLGFSAALASHGDSGQIQTFISSLNRAQNLGMERIATDPSGRVVVQSTPLTLAEDTTMALGRQDVHILFRANAAEVVANFDKLDPLAQQGRLDPITTTDTGVPVLHLVADQAARYADVVRHLVGSFDTEVLVPFQDTDLRGLGVHNTVSFANAAEGITAHLGLLGGTVTQTQHETHEVITGYTIKTMNRGWVERTPITKQVTDVVTRTDTLSNFNELIGSNQADWIGVDSAGMTIAPGAGADIVALFARGGDTVQGTAADLKGDVIYNFTAPGNRLVVTDLPYTPQTTFGTVGNSLSITSGSVHTAMTLPGPLDPLKLHAASNGLGGMIVSYG
jgi:hypothetical protein